MTTDISTIEPKELIPGFKGRFVHSENATIVFWDIAAGSVLPLHSHFHEQVTHVLEGRFELSIDGDTRVYENGLVAIIPGHVPHEGRALTDCKIIDVFCPVREEYR